MSWFSITYKDQADEKLVDLFTNGDKRAFDELYERYVHMLTRYFRKMLWNDFEKAEDLAHDFFTKLIKKTELFDTSRNFKTWMFSVASNTCKNEYKKHEVRRPIVKGYDFALNVSDSKVSVLNEVSDAFFAEAFDVAINEMDEKHKSVFCLRHFEDLSMKEIAEVLNMNEGTVKSRLFYATKQLAEVLKEFDPKLTR
jgi:RNA polymerase sigma-70 factor (ECF subfamily)